MAYPLDRSLTSPAMLTPNANGGATTVRIPARNPKEDPHPKPRTPAIAHTNVSTYVNHGTSASQKPIFPILALFTLSSISSSPCRR